jgi:hypothetical protein
MGEKSTVEYDFSDQHRNKGIKSNPENLIEP